jgi:cytochrome c5
MKKHLVVVLLAAIIAVLAYAIVAQPAVADSEPPCARKTFKIKVVEQACKKGQKSAQTLMKTFVKDVKAAKKADGEATFSLTCNDCHSKLKPEFPLKANGLKDFETYTKYLASKKLK